MANRLKMAKITSILTLHEQGWSARRIARELAVDRETVRRYIRGPDSKPAIAPSGFEETQTSNPANAPTGSDEEEPPASAVRGRRSDCEPFRETIQVKLEQGLSAQRIHQDLVAEEDFPGSYWSVRRFVNRLVQRTPLPFRRMECAAGEEAQVDFGSGAPLILPDGKRRKTWVFRIVLSHSRKGYSEAVLNQTTENFIRCLENAFAHFGGVPRTLVIDNLRAAVSKADWYDPELNPKIQSFCRHYDTVILPTKPYTPRHKGKVESGVKYVKNNALKGRTFGSLSEQNRFLDEWERSIADTRIHGTTKRQVGAHFEQVERQTLGSLRVERFPCFSEGERTVHRDGHVEVDRAYYSVPPEYVTRRVWVRWDSRLVRIFNRRMQQIAMHSRHEPGRFGTDARHISSKKISGAERGTVWLLGRAGRIGGETRRWAEAMIAVRGIGGVRVLQGLLSLANKHSTESIEEACGIALTYGAWRLRTIRKLIKQRAPKQRQFEFLDEHPIIRSLSDYGDLVRQSFQKER